MARYQGSGSVAPDRMGGRRPPRLETHRDLVPWLVGETPHLTIDRLQDLLAAAGIAVCTSIRFTASSASGEIGGALLPRRLLAAMSASS